MDGSIKTPKIVAGTIQNNGLFHFCIRGNVGSIIQIILSKVM